jgi:SAM-dependent methyltransferase
MLQYRLLRRIRPVEPTYLSGGAYQGTSKLDILVGDLLGAVAGKTVIDFGSGDGLEALDLVRRGADRVVGVDLNPSCREIADWHAQQAGLADRVAFVETTDVRADLVISLDSFEHFDDPAEILELIHRLLRPGGSLVASFGPPWLHPLGGHLFSVFPWAHLIFSERALIRWREDIRDNRPQNFREAGLNKMTVRRFCRLVRQSRFELERLDLVPIKRLRRFHGTLTREFSTSVVRCRLRRRATA